MASLSRTPHQSSWSSVLGVTSGGPLLHSPPLLLLLLLLLADAGSSSCRKPEESSQVAFQSKVPAGGFPSTATRGA